MRLKIGQNSNNIYYHANTIQILVYSQTIYIFTPEQQVYGETKIIFQQEINNHRHISRERISLAIIYELIDLN